MLSGEWWPCGPFPFHVSTCAWVSTVELVLTFALVTLVIQGRVKSHSDSDVENPEGKASGKTDRQVGPDKGKTSGNQFSQEKLLEALAKKNL